MTMNNHSRLFSLAAGLALLAGAGTLHADMIIDTPFIPGDRGGPLDVITDVEGPTTGVRVPGFFVDPAQPPLGYIDIPEIDRGPEGFGAPETSESNLPEGLGDFEGPDWLISPFEFDSDGPFVLQESAGAFTYYTSAPVYDMSLDNKSPVVSPSSIPTPGAGLIGLATGLAAMGRRRR